MRRGSAAAGRPLPLPRRLPLLLLLLAGAGSGDALSCISDNAQGMGTTYPREELNLPPNTEFSITCQIDPTHANIIGYTSRDLYFTRVEAGVPRREVPADRYEIVNSTTLRLTERLERRARYIYACRLRHRKTSTMGICHNYVNIGDPPQRIQDFRCVSENWQTVNCSWHEPGNAVRTVYRAEYHTMTQIAKYSKPCNSSKPRWLLAPGQTSHVFCLVSARHFRFSHETFRMNVRAENKLGSNSWDFVFNTYEIVRPAAPVRVLNSNVSTNSVRLRAEIGHPMASFPKPIAFGVEYTSRWNSAPQPVDASAMVFRHSSSHAKGRNTTNATLVAGLLPNTDYRFTVRMRSSMADVSSHPDLWSLPTETVVRTLPTVPGASPRTTQGSFQLNGLAASRSVYVYWRQIRADQQNGPEFGYCALLHQPGRAAVRPTLTTAAYALFKDIGLERYEVSVTACNALGESSDATTLVIPVVEDEVPRPHPVTVAEEPGHYSLVWEQSADTPVDNYTLFWCEHTRDRPFQCEGQLAWTVVAGSRRNHSLQLPPSAEYQFAVAANYRAASSGIVWSRCLLLANGERTQQLDSVYVQNIGATELKLGWRDRCSILSPAGLSYKVYYCVAHDGRCLPGSEGEERSVVQPGDGRSAVLVPGLAPYTVYRLQVAVISGSVEGQRSQPVLNRTAAARPDPPTVTQVTAINSTSLRVSWAAPARPNGRLTLYQLFRTDLPSHDPAQFNASVKSHTVAGLQPYSEYRFQLTACNKAGCSEPGEVVRARTEPGTPGVMEPPRTQLLNTSTVRVTWRRPQVPGGPRPDYQLRTISERRGVNTTKVQTLPTSHTNDGRLVADLPVQECEPGSSQRHLFSVRASVNISSSREDGPWSPLTEQKCVLVSDWPTATIVGVVVGGAVLMMIVVLMFFLLCHRTKRKLSEMRNLGVNMPAGLERPEKAGFPGGPDGGYGRLVSQTSAVTDRTAASVSGQPLLQDDLTREECEGDPSELTPAVNTDSNSCSSSATNYTDSGAECDKGASSPTYSKFQWPVPAAADPQLSPYVQAGGPETAAAAGPPAAPPYTKFSPYVDAKAIQALVARGRSMESLPAGEPGEADLTRSEPDLSGAAPAAGPPPPYSQIGHRSSTGYVSMASEDPLPARPPAVSCAKPRPELKPYVALGPPPPPVSAAGFPPYVLAGPPEGRAGPAGTPQPAWAGLQPAAPASLPAAAAGYVQHDKLQPQMELRDLAGAGAGGYVPQEALASGEPVLSPKKLPTVATARDPYCRVVTSSQQSPPDLGPNVSMV